MNAPSPDAFFDWSAAEADMLDRDPSVLILPVRVDRPTFELFVQAHRALHDEDDQDLDKMDMNVCRHMAFLENVAEFMVDLYLEYLEVSDEE